MSEKEFKNNRPKSDEKDLEGLVQNFSQKVEPAAKKVKKTVGKIERQGMHAAEHYTGDDYTMRGAMVLATCGMAVNNASEYSNSIFYDGTVGATYKIEVTIFARNSAGTDTRSQTFTSIVVR